VPRPPAIMTKYKDEFMVPLTYSLVYGPRFKVHGQKDEGQRISFSEFYPLYLEP
jgi:hypothetical protein